MKKLTIITLNFNTDQDTHTLLRSFKAVKVTGVKLEIIVIDNGSKVNFELTNGEKELGVKLIRSDENTGFAAGNNIGMRYALEHGANYIMLVNNDTIVHPDMIKNSLEVLESDNKIGLTVPKIYFAKGHEFHKNKYKKEELGKILWFAGGYNDWANVRSIHRGVDEVDKGQYSRIEEIEFATGCCMLFKREVLEKVGLFDDRYFLYYEDADLNERVKKAGYKIYYVPKAILVHINASSSGGAGSNLQDYFISRNRMLFGMTYAPLKTKLALFRESMKFLLNGRKSQKLGIRDFYLRKFDKGNYIK